MYNGSGVYNKNNWTFICATYDGNYARLYINGNLTIKDNGYGFGEIYYQPGGLAIGREGDHSSNYFEGIIDEVRLYNCALTENEISILYHTGQAQNVFLYRH